MLPLAPFICGVVFASTRALSSSVHNQMKVYSKAGAIADEVIAGIRTVASFNAQSFEIGRYERQLLEGRRIGIRKAVMTAFFISFQVFVLFASMALVFW